MKWPKGHFISFRSRSAPDLKLSFLAVTINCHAPATANQHNSIKRILSMVKLGVVANNNLNNKKYNN